MFLIDRHKPGDRLVETKGRDTGAHGHHRERIGEGAVVLLREIADRQNLDRQVER